MTSCVMSCSCNLNQVAKLADAQGYAIQFLVLNKKSKNEVVNEIRKVFGDRAMSKARTYVWYDRFAKGCTTAIDLPDRGRKATSATSKILTCA